MKQHDDGDDATTRREKKENIIFSFLLRTMEEE